HSQHQHPFPTRRSSDLGGKTPVVEEGMVELMAKAASSGRVSVTDDVVHAVLRSDVSLICVGTPSAPNGSQDLTATLKETSDLRTDRKSTRLNSSHRTIS